MRLSAARQFLFVLLIIFMSISDYLSTVNNLPYSNPLNVSWNNCTCSPPPSNGSGTSISCANQSLITNSRQLDWSLEKLYQNYNVSEFVLSGFEKADQVCPSQNSTGGCNGIPIIVKAMTKYKDTLAYLIALGLSLITFVISAFIHIVYCFTCKYTSTKMWPWYMKMNRSYFVPRILLIVVLVISCYSSFTQTFEFSNGLIKMVTCLIFLFDTFVNSAKKMGLEDYLHQTKEAEDREYIQQQYGYQQVNDDQFYR